MYLDFYLTGQNEESLLARNEIIPSSQSQKYSLRFHSKLNLYIVNQAQVLGEKKVGLIQ